MDKYLQGARGQRLITLVVTRKILILKFDMLTVSILYDKFQG